MSKQKKSIQSLLILKSIIIILIILVIFLIVKLLAQIFILPQLKQKASLFLLEQYAANNDDARHLLEQMSSDDISTLEEIIDQTISRDDLPTLSQYAINQDIEGLKEYAQNNISEDNKEKLKQLYEKYKNSVPCGTLFFIIYPIYHTMHLSGQQILPNPYSPFPDIS